MASIERTAYPRFKRFMSARELHVFYTPQSDEIVWAREAASSDEHLLARRGRTSAVSWSINDGVEELGDARGWWQDVPASKIADEAASADAAVMGYYAPTKRVALLAALVFTAQVPLHRLAASSPCWDTRRV
jgi:hypothetical protein